MRNGKSFNCNDVGHWRNQLNASMRDPRFAKTLLYNGAQFKDQYIQSYIGGRNGQPLDGASPASYYNYKQIQEEASFVAGNETYFQHVYPLFRYAEVFLNYAEALSAATRDALFTGTIDVDGKPVEFTLSPLKALNAVRTRYGMPALTSVINYESFSPENKTAKLFLASVIARLEVMGVVVGRGEKITAEIFEQEDESLIIYICGKDLINVRAKNTAERLYGVVCETPRDVILKLKKLGNVKNEL